LGGFTKYKIQISNYIKSYNKIELDFRGSVQVPKTNLVLKKAKLVRKIQKSIINPNSQEFILYFIYEKYTHIILINQLVVTDLTI